jgi:genome maintenance exonuclease 1
LLKRQESPRTIFIHKPYNFEELQDITDELGQRKYLIGEDTYYPSVTTVLSSLPNEALEAWKARVGPTEARKVSGVAKDLGKQVHAIAERYLLNEANYARGAMPTALASFNKIKGALDRHISTLHNSEFCLYSHRLKTAGRCDLFAEWDGIPSIIDFKTSKKRKKLEWIENYILQTTCYAMMIAERIGITVPKTVILIAVADLPEPQIFIQNTGETIMKVWDVFTSYDRGQNAI